MSQFSSADIGNERYHSKELPSIKENSVSLRLNIGKILGNPLPERKIEKYRLK